MKPHYLLTCSILSFLCVYADDICKYGESSYKELTMVRNDESPTGFTKVPMVYCCDGYKKVGAEECIPKCVPKCIHGTCLESGDCDCIEGYAKHKTKPNVCEPTCTPPCVNATCKGHNKCDCNSLYEKDEINQHVCKPFCPGGCPHGDCTEPEKCECHRGYNNINSICEPICKQECIKSTCIAPNECRCDQGYFEVENDIHYYKCNPICKDGCSHGHCVRPDKCECDAGYVLSRSNKSLCLPSCDAECINGACDGPNQCSCYEGYKLGAFHCALKCMTSDDGDCYHDAHLSIPPLKYTTSEVNASIELSLNGSITHVPCVHRPVSVAHSSPINYSCFTYQRVEEDSTHIVCSNSTDEPNEEVKWSAVLRSTQIKAVDLVFLHRNSSELCNAQICSNSNRVFILNRISKLSVCMMNLDENNDGGEGDGHLASIGLYSVIIVGIVVSSGIAFIVANRITRRRVYYRRSDRTRDSQMPFIEKELEGGEFGPESFEHIYISDRLEDLQ